MKYLKTYDTKFKIYPTKLNTLVENKIFEDKFLDNITKRIHPSVKELCSNICIFFSQNNIDIKCNGEFHTTSRRSFFTYAFRYIDENADLSSETFNLIKKDDNEFILEIKRLNNNIPKAEEITKLISFLENVIQKYCHSEKIMNEYGVEITRSYIKVSDIPKIIKDEDLEVYVNANKYNL